MALENEYLDGDHDVMTDYKFKIGQLVVGRTRGGWGFGKARIEAAATDPVEGEVFYTCVVLEANENVKIGQSITAYQRDIALYRSAQPVEPVRDPSGLPDAVTVSEAALRKMQPVGTIITSYFPDALRAVAAVAYVGNEKHNPGEKLHWARGKSDDHDNALVRHLIDTYGSDPWNVETMKDGRVFAVLHAANAAWRALALCQLEVEKLNGEVLQVRKLPQVGETR